MKKIVKIWLLLKNPGSFHVVAGSEACGLVHRLETPGCWMILNFGCIDEYFKC